RGVEVAPGELDAVELEACVVELAVGRERGGELQVQARRPARRSARVALEVEPALRLAVAAHGVGEALGLGVLARPGDVRGALEHRGDTCLELGRALSRELVSAVRREVRELRVRAREQLPT